MPKSLGNCVLARKSATPHLKPTMTLSEMKLTIASGADEPGKERNQRDKEGRAGGKRGEPGGIAAGYLPSDAPTRSEIAEVTVTAV